MLFRKPICTFRVSLTNTFHHKDILERLHGRTRLYCEPPTGKNKCYRVECLVKDDFQVIGTLPADLSKKLLTEYANCRIIIKSFRVTYPNGWPKCDVVVEVYK